MGLIARAIEQIGVATTITSWNAGRTRITMPPRATFTKLKRGGTVGNPGDIEQQKRVLKATLELLEQDAPIPYVRLDEE